MKKWRRRILFGAILLGLTGGMFYEMSTYTLRGWWRGEATYLGRPTSYWQAHVEEWLARFETPEDAENYLRANSWGGFLGSTIITYKPPRPTLRHKVSAWWNPTAGRDDAPPAVLEQFAGDAESVLAELEREPHLRRLVEEVRRSQRGFVW